MIKKTFWWIVAVVLGMTIAACNNDAIEVDPEPTPEDSLSNENTPGQYPIEFTTSVIDNSPFVEITDQNIESISLVGTGTQPFENIGRWDGFYCYHISYYSTYVLGNPEPYHFNRSDMPFFYKYKRNKDDRNVWESAEKYLNRYYTWDKDVWQYASVNNPNNTRYHAYSTNSPFLEVASHGSYNMEGFWIGLQERQREEKEKAGIVYLHSEKFRDLVIGFSDVQMYNGTYPDRKTDKVKITFSHVLARLELEALVEDDDAIDVTVGYAAIGGLQTRAVYHPRSIYTNNSYQSDWTLDGNYRNYYAWIEMKTPGNVHLTTEAQPLQAKGAEPWVFPQSLKGWTNAAMADGAGLMLGVWIKNKYDGSYIVGDPKDLVKGYGLVYMPLDPITLESENNYVFEVTFGCQYDVNGNPSGYHVSYQPQIQPWNKTEKEVDMVKK